MARKDEHRMLFDLRGRRKNVVRVVYAVLAVLMGLSLFLVVGGLNLAELFNSGGGGSGEAAKPYQEQAVRLEAKLRKEPDNPDLLVSLTRAQVNAGNAQVTVEPNGTQAVTPEAIQEYQRANQTWSEYVEATDEPNPGVAQLMSSTLVRLAEFSRTYQEASANIEDAVQALQIIAEQRPTVGSFTTLAYYTYFTGDFAAADKAREKAKKMTTEDQAIDKQLDQVEKQAKKYLAAKKEAEAQEKAAAQGQGSPEAGAPEGNPFGGSLGGLGE